MAQSRSKADIERLFDLLNEELRVASVRGELYVAGGAVMCLSFDARESIRDVDRYFRPSREIREAAKRVAAREGLNPDWLNDGVKGYVSQSASHSKYRELSNLTVFVAKPEYLLAMKCLAMRIGEEFQDLDDVRYLLRHLGLTEYQDVLDLITRYYPMDRFPPKTRYALEEMLSER